MRLWQQQFRGVKGCHGQLTNCIRACRYPPHIFLATQADPGYEAGSGAILSVHATAPQSKPKLGARPHNSWMLDDVARSQAPSPINQTVGDALWYTRETL